MSQRLRITFARNGVARYLSHLEMMRAWERALRRAGWTPSYSQGFNPHPRLSFAAPLPVGVGAERELVDLQLDEPRDVEGAREDLARHLPSGISVVSVDGVPADEPPLQRSLRAAEYVVDFHGGSTAALASAVERVMAAVTLPRTRPKEGRAVEYDLRPMIFGLVLDVDDCQARLRVVLRNDAQGAGRCDEVLREMGFDPADCLMTRTRLILSEVARTEEEAGHVG